MSNIKKHVLNGDSKFTKKINHATNWQDETMELEDDE